MRASTGVIISKFLLFCSCLVAIYAAIDGSSGSTSVAARKKVPMSFLGSKISKSVGDTSNVWKSGLSGAVAGAVQVIVLMWLRTTTNVQYRHGISFADALLRIYSEGGIIRFYRGLFFALLQGPLARFAAVASNEIGKAMLPVFANKTFGMAASTLVGALLAAGSRVLLMPLDTCKTVLQVNGVKGFNILLHRIIIDGEWSSLFEGTNANIICTHIAHYPWFLTVNLLDLLWPKSSSCFSDNLILRNALVGFVASAISDIVSNPVRVVKTMKQTLISEDANVLHSYGDILNEALKANGWQGLFLRGLDSRLLSNGLQSMLFTVVWKYLVDHYIERINPKKFDDEENEFNALPSTLELDKKSKSMFAV
jgi:hypothetical protein